MTSGASDRIEYRDGKRFVVKVLPDVKPPAGRSKKSRFHFTDIGKPGTKVSER